MKIIIPMSGFGESFKRVGYSVPKPLIKIDGIHMIGHVINLFPGEKDFIFICNKEHLNNNSYDMKGILESYCPSGKIVGIEPHKKGPVHAVLEVENLIDNDEANLDKIEVLNLIFSILNNENENPFKLQITIMQF